jgi:hypothetical protein
MYDHPPSAVQSLRCKRGSTGAIADLPATLPIVAGYTYSPCLPFYRVHAVVSARVMRSDEAVVPVVEAFEPLISFYIDHVAGVGTYVVRVHQHLTRSILELDFLLYIYYIDI